MEVWQEIAKNAEHGAERLVAGDVYRGDCDDAWHSAGYGQVKAVYSKKEEE